MNNHCHWVAHVIRLVGQLKLVNFFFFSSCDPLQGHLGPIMGLVIAITAPMLSDSKAKVSTGPILPTPLYLLFTTAALASARLVLFDVLLLFLGYPPSAGLLAGASLVALALAQIPLLQQRYPHSQSPRRAVAAVAALGVLLALLRPPLPETVRILQLVNHAFHTGWKMVLHAPKGA